MDKFRAISNEFDRRIVQPHERYYAAYAGLLERYCKRASIVLEIGGGNGAIPSRWAQMGNPPHDLRYFSVEPVSELVDKANKLRLPFEYHACEGGLENSVEILLSQYDTLVGERALVTSRTLHEIFLSYNRNRERLYADLERLQNVLEPKIIIHGIVEKVTTLTPEEVEKLRRYQDQVMGHSHDPSTDYLSMNEELVPFMNGQGYRQVTSRKVIHRVPHFKKSPWRFSIGVFEKEP